jgi:hypothetical protein
MALLVLLEPMLHDGSLHALLTAGYVILNSSFFISLPARHTCGNRATMEFARAILPYGEAASFLSCLLLPTHHAGGRLHAVPTPVAVGASTAVLASGASPRAAGTLPVRASARVASPATY